MAVTDGMQLLPAHVQKYRTKHIVDDVVPYHVAPSFASACVCCSVHGGLGFGLIWPCVADFVFIASSLGFHLQCKVRPCQPVSDLYRSRSSMFMSRSGSHIRVVCLVFFGWCLVDFCCVIGFALVIGCGLARFSMNYAVSFQILQ